MPYSFVDKVCTQILVFFLGDYFDAPPPQSNTLVQPIQKTPTHKHSYNNNNSGAAKHALVIGADALTRWVDWDDRNSCILFGDGAGAMVLSANGNSDSEVGPGILGYAMHSNGKGYDDLKCM